MGPMDGLLKSMVEGYGEVLIRSMMTCDTHGEYESVTTRGLAGATSVSWCPMCEKEAEEEHARQRAEQEAKDLAADFEREREAYARDMKAQNIEPEYFNASFDNFRADTPELANNLAKTKALVAGEVKKLVMTGKNGTGKTHLACAAIHALGGKIMTMYEIATTIRASYKADSHKDELDIVDELASLPLFVIDEIGRTKGSEAETNWLSYIIDKRHTRGLPTILISNKHTRKRCDKNGCPDCLENYIAEDVMSRLNQGGILLHFTGSDYRRGKSIANSSEAE